MISMNNEYITVGECAEMLSFDQATIRRWIKEGRIEAFKVGKKQIRIKRSSLEEFIQSNVQVTAPKIKEEPIKEIPKVHDVIFESASEDDTDMY